MNVPSYSSEEAHKTERLKSINRDLQEALKQIAQLQRDKCETATAEMLFIVLDNKVGIAERAIERADEKDEADE